MVKRNVIYRTVEIMYKIFKVWEQSGSSRRSLKWDLGLGGSWIGLGIKIIVGINPGL